ncbi:MAG: phosphonate C-P lyase system protein PhnH [Sedimenticola sp.]|jgi:alpha-D-ribose 1-methylphosphonate 5-triphosphate synthase subunit PhnH|nr:MAG: phosphonate C-P lyase system protein PhnH [Sedimenticola sp.]
MVSNTEMIKGFDNPEYASQQVFRQVMNAMARPGTVVDLPDVDTVGSLHTASMALCLSFFDYETTVWLSDGLKKNELFNQTLQFHCGCSITENPSTAGFALIGDLMDLPSLSVFSPGNEEYPDRSTSVVIQVDYLSHMGGVRLQGPGVKGDVRLDAPVFTIDFLQQWNENHQIFPLGVDVYLACGRQVAVLPRTVMLGDVRCM